jgi:uncharacterized HAD superfamily protein
LSKHGSEQPEFGRPHGKTTVLLLEENGSGDWTQFEMSGMKIYIDIDDVLAETTRTLAQAARDFFGKKVRFEDMSSFDLRVSLQLNADEYDSFMLAVHEPPFLKSLEPIENAIPTLREWDGSGVRIELITGRPPSSRQATVEWLEIHDIPYQSLEFVDKYGRQHDETMPKLSDLAGRHYDLAIEDSATVAAYLSENTRSRVLLFDRPWNRDMNLSGTSISRVSDWLEISKSHPLDGTPRS